MPEPDLGSEVARVPLTVVTSLMSSGRALVYSLYTGVTARPCWNLEAVSTVTLNWNQSGSCRALP